MHAAKTKIPAGAATPAGIASDPERHSMSRTKSLSRILGESGCEKWSILSKTAKSEGKVVVALISAGGFFGLIAQESISLWDKSAWGLMAFSYLSAVGVIWHFARQMMVRLLKAKDDEICRLARENESLKERIRRLEDRKGDR